MKQTPRLFLIFLLLSASTSCRSHRANKQNAVTRETAEKACADQGKELDIIHFAYNQNFQCINPIRIEDIPCHVGEETLCPQGYKDGCAITDPLDSQLKLTQKHLCVKENSVTRQLCHTSKITCAKNEQDTCQDKRTRLHACYLNQ